MVEDIVIRNTLPETYHKALTTLDMYEEITDCPDWGDTLKMRV